MDFQILMDNQDVEQYTDNIESIQEQMGQQKEIYHNSILSMKPSFMEKDSAKFQQFMQQILEQNKQQIALYFQTQYQEKASEYDQKTENYEEKYYNLLQKLKSQRKDIKQNFELLKEEDFKQQILLEYMNEFMVTHRIKLMIFKVLKLRWQRKTASNHNKQRCRFLYFRRLQRNCLNAWRSMSYKTAYEQSLNVRYNGDVKNIHDGYRNVIETLKQKIKQVEELIRIKKLAKAEFAYSLQKNMLKTISNLSMEVMQLNQNTLKDHQYDIQETQQFLVNVNNLVSTKCRELDLYKEGIREEVMANMDEDEKECLNKKIQFQA